MKTYPYQEVLESFYNTARKEPICIPDNQGEMFFFIRKKDIKNISSLDTEQKIPEFSDEYLDALQRISLMPIDSEQKKRMIYAYSLLEKKRQNPPSLEGIQKRREKLQAIAEKNGFTDNDLKEILNEK